LKGGKKTKERKNPKITGLIKVPGLGIPTLETRLYGLHITGTCIQRKRRGERDKKKERGENNLRELLFLLQKEQLRPYRNFSFDGPLLRKRNLGSVLKEKSERRSRGKVKLL